METILDTQGLLKVAGLDHQPVNKRSYRVIEAFYSRPWPFGSQCSMDDVVKISAQHDIDPLPLMEMLWAVGELEEITE